MNKFIIGIVVALSLFWGGSLWLFGTDLSDELLPHIVDEGECSENFGECFGVDWWHITPDKVQAVDMNQTDSAGNTPLHAAVAYSFEPDIVAAVIAAGADVNAKNAAGETPLYGAMSKPDFIALLVAAGADVNVKDSAGQTPLHSAVLADAISGAVSSVVSETKSPVIQEALAQDSIDAIVALINAGVDVNAKDAIGNTPLHTALTAMGVKKSAQAIASSIASIVDVELDTSTDRDAKMIAVLIGMGADINIKNYAGETAQAIAEDNGILDIYQQGSAPELVATYKARKVEQTEQETPAASESESN